MKKMMLLALAVASVAMFALPAVASATPWHLDATSTFEVKSSEAGTLETTSGTTITCTSTGGKGEYTTTTTANLNLTFHGCKHEIGVSCSTSGQPSGTIVANGLHVDNAMITHNGTTTPGVLVTPPAAAKVETNVGGVEEKLFATFSCFGIPVRVVGNGILGTITSPGCSGKSNKATLSFQQSATPGHQTHISYTGKNYDLTSSTSGGNHETAAINATATVEFPAERTINCT